MFPRTVLRAALLVMLPLFSAAAFAAEPDDALASTLRLPPHKAGIWETKMSVVGERPEQAQTFRTCIGPGADGEKDLPAELRAFSLISNCKHDAKREGDTVTAESVCELNGRTIRMRTVVTGDFASSYTKTYAFSYGQPLGRGDVQSTIEAKYLGACKPGQRPGDAILPDGTTINMPDAQKRGGVGLLDRSKFDWSKN